MIEQQKSIDHHIQKHIIEILMYQRVARFRDLRPPRTDTNLFSYHLKVLMKGGWVKKTSEGYSLSNYGLAYVDRVSTEKFTVRTQPKIVTMLLVQNSEGDVLLQKRLKQPYIDTWTLPYGKIHIDDTSIEAAAQREAQEKLGATELPHLRHAGDAYVRVKSSEAILSTTLAHIFRFETDAIALNDNLAWVQPLKLPRLPLAPAVEAIVARSFFGDEYFFAEFEEDWYS